MSVDVGIRSSVRSPLLERAGTLVQPRGRSDLPVVSVKIMCQVLEEFGLDPAPVLRRADVPSAMIEDPLARISVRAELDVQRAFAAATVDQRQAWVEVGRRYGI